MVSVALLVIAPDLETQHLTILLAAVLLIAFICTVFAAAIWRPKFTQNTVNTIAGVSRFFYSSFLKPLSGDESIGQQAALESFYRVQVYFGSQVLLHKTRRLTLPVSIRPMYTMRPEKDSYVGEKTCWHWWPHNLNFKLGKAHFRIRSRFG